MTKPPKLSCRLRLLAERFERGDWDHDFKDIAGDRVTKIIPVILRMIAKAIEDEAGGGGVMAKLKLINARTADEWAELIQSQWQNSVKGIMDAGLSLHNAREELDTADFSQMVRDKLRFSKGTVSKLITVGTDPRLMEVSYTKLPARWDTLYRLSRLSDEEFQRGLDTGIIHARMEQKDVALLKPQKKTRPPKTRVDISDQMMSCVADVRNAVLRTLEDQPFAEWPTLIKELNAELTDIGSKLAEYEAELRQQGKQE